MSHIHEPSSTERDSSTMMMVLIAIVVGAILIWAIFFSGWIVNRGQTDGPTNIEQREGDTNINVPGGGTQPSTQSSPQPSPATSP